MKQKGILVIDDDSDFTYAVRMILEGEGYLVEEARSGAEGLRNAEPTRPTWC